MGHELFVVVLLLNIITKGYSKVVSIVKLSYDMLCLVSGPNTFC